MSTLAPSPQIRHYSLQVVRFECTISNAKIQSLYAKVRFDNDPDIHRTQKIKGVSPRWNESFTFSSSDTSTRINIRIKRSSFLKYSNPSLGFIDISTADLLEKCSRSSNGEATLDLHPPGGVPGPSAGIGAIHLRLQCTSEEAGACADFGTTSVEKGNAGMKTPPLVESNALPQNDRPKIDQPNNSVAGVRAYIDNAITAIRQHGIANSDMGKKFSSVGDLSSQLGEQSDLYKSIWVLCNKMGAFADVIDKLAIAHPYLNAAWQVTSSLFRVAQKKFENDQSIVELVCTASEAFSFVCEIEELPDKIQILQRAITGLLAQTTELCIFVRHYTSTGLPGQILTIVGNSQKIDEFRDSFRKIKEGFLGPLALQTAFTSARIAEKVDTIYLGQELKPDDMDASGRPECLPGTRSEYLNQIMDWTFSDSTQNILWLHGVAGSGKSTISMTIAEQCLSMHHRGAYLYFERGKSSPKSVIRSIAFWLASFDHSIAKHVSEAVKANNGIAKASLTRQFEVLLLHPLRAAVEDMIGPVVVILDALDECGPPATRRELLKLLAERVPELPSNFRFIITSRPEGDLASAFSNKTAVYDVKLNHESLDSRLDVSAYFFHEMNALFTAEMKRSLPADWHWDVNIRLLGDTAGGLFIWASTAVKHIAEFTITAFPRLDRLVEDVLSRGHTEFGLDALYSSVLLSTQIPWNDEETRLRVSSILFLILEVGIALSTDDIDGILGLPPHNSSRYIISQLQSVLAYTSGPASRIRPLHASFAEFLKSERQSQKQWFMNISDSREHIAKRCLESFDRMDRMLHFNMCEIETSFTCNDCIPDLQKRIERKIVPELENACVYWIQQLRILPYSPDLLSPLDRFLHYHLLSWLEVLSLSGKFDLVISALVDAYKWVEGHSPSLESFLRDARKLVIAFDTPVSKSMPHIYLSMLPLAWPGSEVAAHYSRALILPSNVDIVGNRSHRAPLTIFRGHNDYIHCAAYSPDGMRIASGSVDKTVIVWDSESGEAVAGPFKGHTDQVTSVGFSRNGMHVVSGSSNGIVIVWNSVSGEIICGPLEGHVGSVNCVSFSPDGKHIVSGSSGSPEGEDAFVPGSTIKIWEVESGQAISATFEGPSDPTFTVAYSPDGKHIVSSSYKTLRVWDALSGEIFKLLEGHTEFISSAMFSPDGKRIVSGSYDNTCRVWDLESGKLVAGPFEGHKHSVIFVAFSADGKYIISGSYDSTMKVWDTETGEIISSVVGEDYNPLAFSPDGKRVVSSSELGTFRAFEMQADDNIPDSLKGHANGVFSIAYSPDWKHIVSGSYNWEMVVWDMEGRKVTVGPVKEHFGPYCVAYSPDGKRIASGLFNGTLIIWNAETGEIISGPFKKHTDWIMSVAFSPDGKWVASGSRDKTIIVWDVESGTIIWGPLERHSSFVYSIDFSPDGKYIVSGSADKTIRVWGTETGETVLALFEGHAGVVNSVAYSPDGEYIVSGSGDGTAIVWSAKNGVIVAGPLKEHKYSVESVQFSPDGRYVVSGSSDSTIIVWEVESGKVILGPLRGHTGGVMSVQFSPDGRHVASGSHDGAIMIWDLENAVALSASSETNIHQNWMLSEDGWVLGQEGELLIWIPPDIRASLWHPRNAVVINRFITKLHFTGRGMGENWREFYDPQKLLAAE